jgi:hypothetical protein
MRRFAEFLLLFLALAAASAAKDASGLKPRIERVQMHGTRAAEARILLDFGTPDARTVSIQLVQTKPGWRVADVATKGEPSLLRALRRSNGER